MESHGFKINPLITETNCEFHYGVSKNKNDIVFPPFPIHQDDFGGTDWPTVTCIIYLDVTCSGGELEFYHNDKPNAKCFRSILTRNPSANTCKVVIFDGSLFHKANNYSNGRRCAISFQLPKLT